MPSRVRHAVARCSSPVSVTVQLQQLLSSYSASWFTSPSARYCCSSSYRRQSGRSHSNHVTATIGPPKSRSAVSSVGLRWCVHTPFTSQRSFSHVFFFSSSSRHPHLAAASDTAASVPRILSPTLPSDSPAFSLTKWLSHKLGYSKYRPIIRLYASLSERAKSDSFTHSNTTAIAACPSTACALLTLHMWVLNARLRGLAHGAWREGREADAKELHAKIRLLFNLAWQEMEHTLADSSEQQQPAAEGALPSHYTINDYQQLSYGAMVSYDRAWSRYRETGQRSDLVGALWRNVWTTAIPLHAANLQALATYVEHAVQLSNRWTERGISVDGAVQWPTLQVDQHSQASELLTYDSQLYDGSRVSAEESVGVPMKLWETDDDDLLLVDTRKSRRRLEGEARKVQQLPPAGSRVTDSSSSSDTPSR